MDNNISADSNLVVEALLNQNKDMQKTNAILQAMCYEKDQLIKQLQEQLDSKTKKASHK